MAAAKKVVIVGAVAGGAAAATRLRRLDQSAHIILFEAGHVPSFANCGMPYHLGNVIPDKQKLLMTTVDSLKNIFEIDVRVQHRVEAIDKAAQTISGSNLQTGAKFTESYDTLILATGSKPRELVFPGSTLPNVFTLRTLSDMEKIKASLDTAASKSLTIIGAGFVGLEVADAVSSRGFKVSIVELMDQVCPPLDKEMTVPIAAELIAKGIDLYLADSVQQITQKGDSLVVELKSGASIESRTVLLSIGVVPDSELAKSAGLKLSQSGGVITSPEMLTSDSHIYAVGDVVEVEDFVTHAKIMIPLAGPAARQGRIVADNIAGRHSTFRGTQGTFIFKVGVQAVGSTGATEKSLKRNKMAYHKVYVHPFNHASYFPGATTLSAKLAFAPDGKILGAQAVGEQSVDKFIDTIATAIQGGLSVFDLEELEAAYSPQFGSAKSPVNMAGFVAAGFLRGDQPHVYYEDLAGFDPAKTFVLDVRSPPELISQGAIEGATNIQIGELRKKIDLIPKDKKIVCFCRVSQRAYNASKILKATGRDAVILSGGILTYNAHHKYPRVVVKSSL